MADPPLTFRRLVGLDRSGGPPPQTRRGQPLNPWTIPNAIGYLRLAAIPVFLVLALSSRAGQDTLSTVLFAAIPLLGESVGGDFGRSVRFNVGEGSTVVSSVGKADVVL